jgi:hypothetical protein
MQIIRYQIKLLDPCHHDVHEAGNNTTTIPCMPNASNALGLALQTELAEVENATMVKAVEQTAILFYIWNSIPLIQKLAIDILKL